MAAGKYLDGGAPGAGVGRGTDLERVRDGDNVSDAVERGDAVAGIDALAVAARDLVLVGRKVAVRPVIVLVPVIGRDRLAVFRLSVMLSDRERDMLWDGVTRAVAVGVADAPEPDREALGVPTESVSVVV
jgi:hypothetical protein